VQFIVGIRIYDIFRIKNLTAGTEGSSVLIFIKFLSLYIYIYIYIYIYMIKETKCNTK
jgi:hypothetical protein